MPSREVIFIIIDELHMLDDAQKVYFAAQLAHETVIEPIPFVQELHRLEERWLDECVEAIFREPPPSRDWALPVLEGLLSRTLPPIHLTPGRQKMYRCTWAHSGNQPRAEGSPMSD